MYVAARQKHATKFCHRKKKNVTKLSIELISKWGDLIGNTNKKSRQKWTVTFFEIRPPTCSLAFVSE